MSSSSADCKMSMLWNWYTVDACAYNHPNLMGTDCLAYLIRACSQLCDISTLNEFSLTFAPDRLPCRIVADQKCRHVRCQLYRRRSPHRFPRSLSQIGQRIRCPHSTPVPSTRCRAPSSHPERNQLLRPSRRRGASDARLPRIPPATIYSLNNSRRHLRPGLHRHVAGNVLQRIPHHLNHHRSRPGQVPVRLACLPHHPRRTNSTRSKGSRH